MSATPPRSNPAWTAFILVLMPVLFSSNLIVGRAAVATVEPFTLAFWRFKPIRPSAAVVLPIVFIMLGWLLVSMGLTVFFAGRALARERGLLLPELDAARHLVALGVLMLTIMAMAHMVLPEFAMERLQARSGRGRAWGLGLALSVAAATRAAPGIADQGVPSDTDSWHMAVAGMITLAALAWFGVLLLRALRRQPQLLAEVRVRIQEIRLR